MGEARRRELARKAADNFRKVYRQWPEVPVAFNPDTDKEGVFIVSVAHDDNCPAIGTGVGCICNPDVRRFKVPNYQ